jgi:hypothetical protein
LNTSDSSSHAASTTSTTWLGPISQERQACLQDQQQQQQRRRRRRQLAGFSVAAQFSWAACSPGCARAQAWSDTRCRTLAETNCC